MSIQITRREFVISGAAALSIPATEAHGLLQLQGQIGVLWGEAVFPFGAHIYREPSLPLSQYEHDLPVLRKLGFNMVKIQEVWAANERREGELDVERIVQILRLARQNELLVYFGVTMEVAPSWLWQKFPDAHMVLRSGEPLIDETPYVLPEDGKPGPCWNHPGAREAAISFLGRLTRKLSDFRNICVWNVWQEIGLDAQTSREDPTSLSYSPYTLSAFRSWLRTRYSSIDSLNDSWKTYFSAWDQVQPPRRFQQVPSFIDWRFFMQNVYLAKVLEWKAGAIKRNDPLRRPVMAHVANVDTIGSVDWLYARKVDAFGGSFYPGWGERTLPGAQPDDARASAKAGTSMHDIALSCDLLRSASDGNFWAAEVQGGRAPGGLFPGRVPSSADIRRWVLMLLAGGARGLCFWNHRDEALWAEAFGFGLLDMDGDSTERAYEAGRISKAISERAAVLLRDGSCPRAPIAIVVNEDLRSFLSAAGDAAKSFESNLRAFHSGLWRAGVAVDFIDIDQISSSACKTLLLPNALALGDDCIATLTTFVATGGTLIAEAGTGRLTRYGLARNEAASNKLSALFGAISTTFTALPSTEGRAASDPMLDGVGPLQGVTVKASIYLETFEAQSASVILEYRGKTAGTRNIFGHGHAIMLGTLAGADCGNNRAETLLLLLPELRAAHSGFSGVIRRTRVLGKTEAWFLINPTSQAIEETVSLAGFSSAVDMLTGERVDVLPGRDMKLTIDAHDVRCVLREALEMAK